MTPHRTGPATRGRRGVALVLLLALLPVLGWVAVGLLPATAHLVTLHSGSESWAVAATLDPRTGCGPVTLVVTGRDGQSAETPSVTVSASNHVAGHIQSPVSAVGSGSTLTADEVCLPMTGHWQLSVEMTSVETVERILIPVSVGG